MIVRFPLLQTGENGEQLRKLRQALAEELSVSHGPETLLMTANAASAVDNLTEDFVEPANEVAPLASVSTQGPASSSTRVWCIQENAASEVLLGTQRL